MSFLYKFLLPIFIFCFFFNAVKAESGFYLLTEKNERIPLFRDQNNFKEISYPYIKAKDDLKSKLEPVPSKKFLIKLPSKDNVRMDFFDRKSDKLLIFGNGFFSTRKRWKYIIQLFKNYDIVVFDYRTNPWWTFLNPAKLLHPFKKMFFDQAEEVIASFNVVTKLKKYSEVVGLAECYSCFMFAVAQLKQESEGKKLFDKLVLDSSFISFTDVYKMAKKKPNQSSANNLILSLTPETLIPDISIKTSLSQIKNVPILFIQGKQDSMFSLEAFFSDVWVPTTSQKVLFLTPYEHVHNGTDWGVYSFICNQFINNPFKSFIEKMRNL